MWIAGKRQKVKRNGEYVWIEAGDPIPEAENFVNQKKLIRWRFIRWVDRPEDKAPKKTEKAEVVKTEVKPVKKAEPKPEPKPKKESKPEEKPKSETKPKAKSKTKAKKKSKSKPKKSSK